MPGLEGTTLGHYQLLGRLGRGGMSEVYLAYDEQQNRNVALKVVSSSHTDYLERFQREADAIRRLHHDHILPAFDYGDQEPWHYLVMPFVEHGTLRDILDIGPMTLQHANELLQQIASALQSAHDNGIIHRDIKPSNILLRDKHYAYLADFGLAKELEGASSITQTGALLGTPEYMAPDLADGPATTSSDIYALGVMLYQMVTGRVPFSGETPVSVYMKHLREQPMPPSFYNSKLPRSVDQVILRALEKDPRRRFSSIHELADAFQRAVTTPSVHDTQEMMLSTFPAPPESVRPGSGDTPIPTTRRYGRQARQARQARQNRTPSSPNRRFILPGNTVTTTSSRSATPVTPLSTIAPPAPVTPVVTDPLPPSAFSTLTQRRSEMHTTTSPEEDKKSNAAQKPVRQPARRIQGTQRGQGGHGGHGTGTPRRANRTVLASSIIITGILLFIVLPLSLVYYNYNTHRSTTSASPTVVQTSVPTAVAPSPGQGTPPVSATALAATSATPIFADSLTANTNGRWTDDKTHCLFSSDAYHVRSLRTDAVQSCTLGAPEFYNAALEVDVTLLSGHSAGMLFRVSNDTYYDFEITDQGQFFLRRHDSGAGTTYVYLVNPRTSTAIASEGQKNTLLVIANGGTIQLFINNVAVGTVNDTAYALGQIALACGTQAPQTTGEAIFANFKAFAVS